MPKKPQPKVRRVVCRYHTVRLDDGWWGKAYDQGGDRYPEADILLANRANVRAEAMRRVNAAFTASPL